MEVLYEDNHIIIVNKAPGEIVQGDKTGDTPLSETIKHTSKRNTPSRATCSAAWYTALTAPWVGSWYSQRPPKP